MSTPKISLIIAMYNIRDYIGECITSCLNQKNVSLSDYEIIIVNDGSTDDSADIAFRLIRDCKNARLINKQNGGLSDARNFGLEHALGDYIWYIDGDDIIIDTAVSTLINATKTNAQVYIIDYLELYPDGTKKRIKFSSSRLPDGIFNGHKLLEEGKIPFPPLMAWLQIQNRNFIIDNELLFLKDARSEDIEYTAKLFSVANKVCHINVALYSYRQNRSGSIINALKNDTKWIKNLLNIYLSVSDYFYDKKISDKYSDKILAILSAMLIHYLFHQDKDKYIKSRKLIEKTGIDIYKSLYKGPGVRFKIKAYLYKYLNYEQAKRFF